MIDYFSFILNRKIAKKLRGSILTYPFYLIYLIKHLGFINFLRLIFSIIRNKKQPSLSIRLYDWPDPMKVDIEVLKSYELDHVAMDGSINTFFETLILNEKIRKNLGYSE